MRGARGRQRRLWDYSQNVAHASGLFITVIVDVVGSGAKTLLERVELWAVDAIGRNLCQTDAACSAQTLCEECFVKACIAFLQEFDEARIADRSGAADRIDVEIVAGVAPGVQSAQFVTDGILNVKNGANVEANRCVGAPVDSEINAEWNPVRWCDGELGERGSYAFDGDVVVVGSEVFMRLSTA